MNNHHLETPVIFIIFNRPDTTAKVFEAIRQAKPKKLLVVADGARSDKEGEAEKCAAVRAIIDTVDWDCEVLKNYSDVNLGCRKRVSSGLDWAFSLVDEAIILEDDCLPDSTFFPFCQELLEKYRDDKRIMAISGDNFQFGRKRTNYSYYFSRFNDCWGWATWDRAWQYYDHNMKLWEEIRNGGWLKDILNNDFWLIQYRKHKLQSVYDKKIDSWAYLWTFSCWIQNGLIIIPNQNLVSNIGFSSTSTHTTDVKSPIANLPTQPISFPLQHPPFIIPNTKADNFRNKKIFGLLPRAIRKIKRILSL
ncbi:glycosyltransferase family 2 protein [Euhalothece natronophila Z-M001]|uniref:Glycosyltransferase family 2 protein n=1 Tax=Euhalothece natronophila Z-M001 TaxID=522448 RepID=A0A5B8NR71_9CHRO|nr:glycosyltransferase family 2 protein [Euhalothece natronophila]QDZ40715.1 glycosyltransferase family 2 protein [Euhalothece natronophila Z-M001]